MDPILMSILATLLMLVLMAIGIPIAFAMLIAGVVGLAAVFGFASVYSALGHFAVARVGMYALTTIPLFILMGQWGAASGIAADAYTIAYNWLGRIRGSLGIVTVTGSALMGATTGSTVAVIGALGPIVIPEMRRYGYDMRLALGCLTVSGTLANMIPPSIGFVLYGVLTEQSIAKLFLAGIMPGVLTALVYMGMIYTRCRINPQLAPTPPVAVSWRERLTSLGRGWGIFLVFVVVIGGLYTGIATPTEVGALGCAVTLVLLLLAIRRGNASWTKMKATLVETVRISAMCFAFLIGAGVFSLFMTMSGALPAMVEAIKGWQVSPMVILVGICLLFLPLGMFFDPISLHVVTIPMIYPLIVALGFNGIWFGVIFEKLIEVALVTPPVAINLYAMKATFPEASLEDIIRGSMPFLAMEAVSIAILIAFPQISLWLPSMMR